MTDAPIARVRADVDHRFSRLRWQIACLAFKAAAERFEALRRAGEAQRLHAKYDPNQPRDELGRWTDGNGSNELSSARRRGGFSKELTNWTARQFISKFCDARINREFPGEFENATIGDILALARGGDARARTCLKLLKQPRFRK